MDTFVRLYVHFFDTWQLENRLIELDEAGLTSRRKGWENCTPPRAANFRGSRFWDVKLKNGVVNIVWRSRITEANLEKSTVEYLINGVKYLERLKSGHHS